MKWTHPLEKVDPVGGKLAAIAGKITALENEARALRASAAHDPVEDFALKRPDGSTVRLSELFGKKEQLVLVHNMGKACGYCTMWADGFNALFKHVEKKAAFAVASNDTPAEQAGVIKARGWKFPMVSARGTAMFKALGFADDKGQWYPGVSVLTKSKAGGIRRFAGTAFGPGDKFNSVFSFFELLPGA